MSDNEINWHLAELVMGWHSNERHDAWLDADNVHMRDNDLRIEDGRDDWNPLEHDDDACAVLDRMGVEQGLDVHLNRTYGLWTCSVHHRAPGMAPPSMDHSAGRRFAICLAALKAVDVEVED